MRRKGVKELFKFKGRRVYILFMLIGISMIFWGYNKIFLFPHLMCFGKGNYQISLFQSLSEELSSVIMNLGISIFPTGIVGWMFEKVNEKNHKIEISDKRAAILKQLSVLFQRYLSEACYQYQELNKEKNNYYLSEINVLDSFNEMSSNYTDALSLINKGKMNWTEKEVEEFFRNELETTDAIENVLNAILFNKDVYIINDIFSEDELIRFGDLEESMTKFKVCINNGRYIKGAQERCIIMEIIYNIITHTRELSNRFKNLRYINGGIK